MFFGYSSQLSEVHSERAVIHLHDHRSQRMHSILRHIFISRSEPRLRAGWRLLIQTTGFLALTLFFGIITVIPYIHKYGGNTTGVAFLLWGEVMQAIPLILSIFLSRRYLDRRSFGSLGLKLEWRAITDIAAGIFITFIMMGIVYISMSFSGWIKFIGFAWQSAPPLQVIENIALIVLIFIIVGWSEELLFRGYHLQTIASGLGRFWGVILSSVIFGVMHLMNPNATLISAGGIFFAGLFFSLGYLRTGQLWLPIGMHVGWNLFEGSVFGFPVSGLDVYKIIHIQVTGPDIWTGGKFGPEAGILIIPTIIIGALMILLFTRNRNVIFSK